MSYTPITSPALASASLYDPLAGPATPDSSALRPVQKQVVQVRGKADGSSVTLYLRLAIPNSGQTQVFQLFPDEGISLRHSHVYQVTFISKGGKVALPSDASPRLQRALEALSLSTLAPPTEHNNHAETSSLPVKKAKITTSNFHVSLVAPPQGESGDERSHYIATVNLVVPYELRPPEWPYVIHIPVPRCLNNTVHFSVEDSCVQENTTVVVQPPLIMKITQPDKKDSDPETKTEDDVAQGEYAVSGQFVATRALCIRWAGADAGLAGKGTHHTFGRYPTIRAKLMQSDITYSNLKRTDDQNVEIAVEASLTFTDIHYPGLDTAATLDLHLEGDPGVQWLPGSVSASSPIKMAIHSCSLAGTSNSLKHSMSSTLKETETKDVASSPSMYSSDGSQKGETTLDDEGFLLDVQPPKDLISSRFDLASDTDDEAEVDSRPVAKDSRRHSLGPRRHGGEGSSVKTSKRALSAHSNRIISIDMNTTSLQKIQDDFTCALHGILTVPSRKSSSDSSRIRLPVMRVPGMALASRVTLKGSHFHLDHRNEIDQSNERAGYTLKASPSPSELEKASVNILFLEAEETMRDISTATTETVYEHSSGSLNESLQLDTRSVGVKDDGTNGMDQIDLLSGMIQQAMVEIHLAVTVEADLLRLEGVRRKIKSTHRIQLTWPSAPASASSPQGSLLRKLVLAIPRSGHDELQLLHASINGSCVTFGDMTSSPTPESSHIVDLELPSSIKAAEKVEAHLIYCQVLAENQSLCVFPPIASSIAELSLNVHYGAVTVLESSSFEYASKPLTSMEQADAGQHIKRTQALMLPSSTSVYMVAKQIQLPKVTVVTPEPKAVQSLIRSPGEGSIANNGFRLHFLCTLLLAVTLIGTIFSLGARIDSLSHRVDSLALALDIDFSDGTWTPDPVLTSSQLQSRRSDSQVKLKEQSNLAVRVSMENTDVPNELSTDTTSFALLLRSISMSIQSSLYWPLRIILALFARPDEE